MALKKIIAIILICVLVAVSATGLFFHPALAADETGEFSIQVSPSPLFVALNPGETKTVELKIRNNGLKSEDLKIYCRSFTLSDNSSEIRLDDQTPAYIDEMVSFSQENFTVKAGEWFTQRLIFKIPEEAGFSYSFAVVIDRQKDAEQTSGQTSLRGSVAVFALINVNRPDAQRRISIKHFSISQGIYEYLPAEFTITVQNTGNTIVQPYGNIYIESGSSDKPLAVLPVNETKAYILPATTRNLKTEWSAGFPYFKTVKTADNAEAKSQLVWDWKKLSDFRIGRYRAKLVAVYNDGSRDIPLTGEINFWVIPWKLLLFPLILLLLLIIGTVSIVKKGALIVKSLRKKTADTDGKTN